jgi:hypothetical protein
MNHDRILGNTVSEKRRCKSSGIAKHLADEKQLGRMPVKTSSDGLSPRAARAVVV